jgi:pSer/pThr/pTyr-binding forkhead associated (FHA) protein
MKASLIVLTAGKMYGQAIAINQTQFVIGREALCHLRPANPVISNRHCAILIRGDGVFIKDFDSMNGTFVNDQPIKGEAALRDRDRLRLGPLEFEIRLHPEIAPKKPAPAKSSGGETEDEAAAALLLSLQDEGSPAPPAPVDSQGIPTGSTIMDMRAETPLPGEPGSEEAKEKEKKTAAEKAKKLAEDTPSAASNLLQKYLRRPRR